MDRLEAMEVFVKVAELGSFTAASQALRRPRSTVTASVQELEARLGVKLLHRTTRRVSLTGEGASYLREVRRILSEVEDLEAELGERAGGLKGRVRVDVAAAAGRHIIAPALPGFFALYPEITLELGSSDRPVDLLAEGVDCVIRGGEIYDESLVARRLGAFPVATLAAPSYLDRWGIPRAPDALDGHTFVAFFSPRTGEVFAPEFEVGGVLRSLPAPHRLAVNDADTWVAAGLAGLGLVQLPMSRVVRAHVQRGELVQVLSDFPAGSLPIHLLYPRSRRLPARVRAFIEWAAALYAAESAPL